MTDEILTIREVAEYLKVTEKTVYGLAQKRLIPGFKVGGQWRFRCQDIDAWIASQTADTLGKTNESESAAHLAAAPSENRGRRKR